MRSIALTVAFFCFAIFGNAQTKTQQLDDLLTAYAKQYQLNGSVLILQGDSVVLSKGYGYQDVKRSIPNSPATIFQIGSLTKQFTAAAILKLQESGQLQLSETVTRYFPGFPKGDSITLEHLLTHTSGLFNYTDDPVFMQTQAMKPVTEDVMVALISGKPLLFSPGKAWSYSNSNYNLLGYIIQKVTGKPYEQVIRELILSPLQMNETGFDFANLQGEQKAKGYKALVENTGVESVEFDSTVSFAAGGLYSTTGDLHRWQKALASNQLINKDSYTRMTNPVGGKYGYGLYIDSIYNRLLFAHGGLAFGFTAYLASIEQDRTSIIILNNVANPAIAGIAKDVFAVLYNKPYQLPVAKKAITLSLKELEVYRGTYQLGPKFFIKFDIEDGQLVAIAEGQPKTFLLAEKTDLFFVRGAAIQVQFNRDPAGNVSGLLLLEDGMRHEGNKLK